LTNAYSTDDPYIAVEVLMKNILFSVVFPAAIISGCVVFGGGSPSAGDDVREGTGRGYRGPISVQVRMSGGSITEIIIIDSAEDAFVGAAAIEELIDTVIEYNTTDVDVVTGATESSRGFLEAVENAIMGVYE
jgi:hypothetical protein